MSIFTSFFKKIRGSSNHKVVPHIEGAEKILIDSSVLCCPVCYEVYGGPPLLLRCGHTFCDRCVRTMKSSTLNTYSEEHKDVVFQCPLCRENVSSAQIYKNYIIDDLLRTVDMVTDEGGDQDCRASVKYALATMRLSKDRADKRAQDLEIRNNSLSKELDTVKKHLSTTNAVVASVVILYFGFELLTKLYRLMFA